MKDSNPNDVRMDSMKPGDKLKRVRYRPRGSVADTIKCGEIVTFQSYDGSSWVVKYEDGDRSDVIIHLSQDDFELVEGDDMLSIARINVIDRLRDEVKAGYIPTPKLQSALVDLERIESPDPWELLKRAKDHIRSWSNEEKQLQSEIRRALKERGT